MHFQINILTARRLIGMTVPVLLGMALSSCSKSSSSSTAAPDAATYSLKMRMLSTGSSSLTAAALNQPAGGGLSAFSVADTAFLNGNIGSGVPDELTIKITKITLKKQSDLSVSVPIFSDSAGKAITVRGSSVDLSSFFTKMECVNSSGVAITLSAGQTCECGVKADGTLIQKISATLPDGSTGLACPELAVGEEPPLGVMAINQVGTFDQISVEFLNLGQIKGCVSGKYKANNSDTVGASATNCTKSGNGLDSGNNTTVSTFPSSGEENMNFYFSRMGPYETSSTFTKQFYVPGGFTISADAAPSITLLIDTGRLLRFYNGNSSVGETPGPMYNPVASKAFFFTTVFEDSVYMFLGKPGSIKGYRWAASAKNWGDTSVPSDRLCTSDCKTVAGWMTVVTDSTGAPLMASLMPDDDNALTVLKGATYSTTTSGLLDLTAVTVNSATNWNIKYNLGADVSGTIYGFDPSTNLEGSGDSTFQMTSTSSRLSYGQVTFKRKL